MKKITYIIGICILILISGCYDELNNPVYKWGFDINKCNNFSICDWDNCSYYEDFDSVNKFCDRIDYKIRGCDYNEHIYQIDCINIEE